MWNFFINSKSKGKKHWNIQNEAFLVWKVPYERGSIEAIGTLPSGENVTYKIQTTGEPEKIVLIPDKKSLKAQQQDITYVEIQLLDANNNLVPFTDDIIDFEVTGAGKLLAVGNGNQDSHTPFYGNRMEAFHGKCLAIVQAGSNSGKITLTAKSDGLQPASVEIVAK